MFTVGLFTAMGYLHASHTANGTVLAILDAEVLGYIVLSDVIRKTHPYSFD